MIQKIILPILCAGFLFMVSDAMAFGIGAYATVGGGGSTFKTTTLDYNPNITASSSDFTAGAGLILDTNLAADSLFNYRLKLGGGKRWIDREKKISMARLNLSNIFGFGIIRTGVIRWWLGPQLGGIYSWGKRSDRHYYGITKESDIHQALFNPPVSIIDFWPSLSLFDKMRKIYHGGVNLGIATGVNINIGNNFTIALETGCTYNLSWGNQYRTIYELQIPLSEINHFREKIFVRGWELYGEFAFLFRLSGAQQNHG